MYTIQPLAEGVVLLKELVDVVVVPSEHLGRVPRELLDRAAST